MEKAMIEGLNESLFSKLRVVDGDISAMLEPGSGCIAIDVHTDDYGNVYDMEYYPAIGEKITVQYVDDGGYVDSRTGEAPEDGADPEDIHYEVQAGKEVTYTVCAYVEVPYSMGYRFSTQGYSFVLPRENLEADSGAAATPIVYLFDTPDAEAEAAAESYIANLTGSEGSMLEYESKATLREEFSAYQSMFLLVGGLLCFIIGIVGILNFINAIMTGILSRQREFAVLQAVGMTGKQLKSMLIYEGLFYSLGSALIALVLSLVLSPLAGNVLEGMFWFFTARFTILPVLGAVPIFALLGWGIPGIMYHQTEKRSVVERLRETE